MNDVLIELFVHTDEYSRFMEFCDACKRYRYIGLCYGSPGVGKTISARHYTNWESVMAYWNQECQTKALLKEISRGNAVFYTSPVVSSLSYLERDIAKTRGLLHKAAIERAQRYEQARLERLLSRAEKLRDPKKNPDGYRSDEAVKAEDAFHDQRSRAMRVAYTLPDPTALLIVDEADRLKMAGLEQVRNVFDHGGIGLVLIGMPGIEKRLARYPQLYSRIGFVHEFRPLTKDQILKVLHTSWRPEGVHLPIETFDDESWPPSSASPVGISACFIGCSRKSDAFWKSMNSLPLRRLSSMLRAKA
ncbi:MAG: AAA family ATPase [Verrucomicrobia bacterium]|nr:AAA family ATPase [Verrucomicrobiota bacterium]